jgi:hypothetical protein
VPEKGFRSRLESFLSVEMLCAGMRVEKMGNWCASSAHAHPQVAKFVTFPDLVRNVLRFFEGQFR